MEDQELFRESSHARIEATRIEADAALRGYEGELLLHSDDSRGLEEAWRRLEGARAALRELERTPGDGAVD